MKVLIKSNEDNKRDIKRAIISLICYCFLVMGFMILTKGLLTGLLASALFVYSYTRYMDFALKE